MKNLNSISSLIHRFSASMETLGFLKSWELATPGCQRWLVPWCVFVCGGGLGRGERRDTEEGVLWVSAGGSSFAFPWVDVVQVKKTC